MAIDWTPVVVDNPGLQGTVEYRVENDGLVRWRGTIEVLITGGYGIIIPPEAQPLESEVPRFIDWAAGQRSFQMNDATAIYVAVLGVVGPLDMHPLEWQGTVPPPVIIPHSLENVQAGLTAALRNIVGLRVYDFPSDRVEPPAAVLSLPETGYDMTLGGRNDRWQFPLWVLVAKADDKASYGEMTGYLEAEGPKSIRAMIETDRTLGGACDTSAVLAARPLFATVAGTEFLAVEFTLEVYT